jgi:anti-sigma factor RsiW
MIECAFQLRLDAYHDGELDAAERARVEAHLSACSTCAAELAEMRALSARIGAAAAIGAIGTDESLGMHEAVRREAQQARDERERSIPLLRTAGMLSALAASVLIISGVWLMELRPGAGMSGPSRQQVARVAVQPEWERVAMTLRADPRPELIDESRFADSPHYAAEIDWMLRGLDLSAAGNAGDQKSWEKPGSF